MTHAQLIEATKLKLEELQAKAEEKQQTEREKLEEKLTALRAQQATKTEAYEAKVEKLVEAHKQALAKIDEKITIIELELGVSADDNADQSV
jgi:N12 class adenine-specific DNA methylase